VRNSLPVRLAVSLDWWHILIQTLCYESLTYRCHHLASPTRLLSQEIGQLSASSRDDIVLRLRNTPNQISEGLHTADSPMVARHSISAQRLIEKRTAYVLRVISDHEQKAVRAKRNRTADFLVRLLAGL
jgi:hypothetical protein